MTSNTPKLKRVVYTDDQCHKLVDIITKYKDVVECKITDATTWKEKDSTWHKIAAEFNCAATVPRTVKQLREKFYNLKKDVRRYYAKQRQCTYKTGGGPKDPDVRATLKHLYDKIMAIIQLSVFGMEPHPADSDSIAPVFLDSADVTLVAAESEQQPMPIEESTESERDMGETSCSFPDASSEETADTVQDWGSYSPAMLRRQKNLVLQTKKFKANAQKTDTGKSSSASVKVCQELAIAKKELALLKMQLLNKEAQQSEELHQLKLQKEKDLLYNERIEGQKLKNEVLRLQIAKLSKNM